MRHEEKEKNVRCIRRTHGSNYRINSLMCQQCMWVPILIKRLFDRAFKVFGLVIGIGRIIHEKMSLNFGRNSLCTKTYSSVSG